MEKQKKNGERLISDDKIDALSNIAVIGPSINIRISDKEPMNYIKKYDISLDKLRQQYISDDITTTPVEQYDTWLLKRAQTLAEAGNSFLDQLKGDL